MSTAEIELLMPETQADWFDLAAHHSGRIEQLEREMLDVAEQIESLRRSHATREAEVMERVTAKQLNGKPMFTNDAARKAAVATWLSQNEIHVAETEMLADRERRYAVLKIDRDSSARLFSLFKRGFGA